MMIDLAEIRALLRDFKTAPWKDLHVQSSGWSVFLAKPGGAANPMLSPAGEVTMSGSSATATDSIIAPHLGYLERVVKNGDQVGAGSEIGSIRVLDRITPVLANRSGAVEWVGRHENFVEYGAQLAVIAG